jgi:ParB-like chromosome segregation protein Spo0J
MTDKPMTTPTMPIIAKTREMHAAGFNDARIASALQFSKDTIQAKRTALGLPSNIRAVGALTAASERAAIVVHIPPPLRVDRDKALKDHFAERIYINGEYRLDGRLITQTAAIIAMQKERIDQRRPTVRFYV